jgi:hypothetical protein
MVALTLAEQKNLSVAQEAGEEFVAGGTLATPKLRELALRLALSAHPTGSSWQAMQVSAWRRFAAFKSARKAR